MSERTKRRMKDADESAVSTESSGELEKVVKIKAICELAVHKLEWADKREEGMDEEKLQSLRAQSKQFKDKAMELTRDLTDQFCRDAALHCIIKLCMATNEVGEAKRLFAGIKVDVIKDSISESYPELAYYKKRGRTLAELRIILVVSAIAIYAATKYLFDDWLSAHIPVFMQTYVYGPLGF